MHHATAAVGPGNAPFGLPGRARSVVFLFPGQSSADRDMLLRARQAHPASAVVVDAAHRVLGARRAAAYLDAGGTVPASNRDNQVTVFLATQMYLAALEAEGLRAEASAGLSLGEYSHLVDIGALDLESALGLVDERGRCYDEAPPGIMVSVLAVEADAVALAVARGQAYGPVVVSNYNAPTQHVLAGARPAVEWAAAHLEEEYGAHTTLIESRVPMHSPMMAPVAARLAPTLRAMDWRMPARSYWPNVEGAPAPRPASADIASHLVRHVTEPVFWQATIDRLAAAHGDALFFEVGPGRVVHNLLRRAWKQLESGRVDGLDSADPAAHFRATVEVLRAGR